MEKVNYISVVKGDNLRTIQTILGLILHSHLGFQKWPNLHNQKISDTNNLKCRYFGNIKKFLFAVKTLIWDSERAVRYNLERRAIQGQSQRSLFLFLSKDLGEEDKNCRWTRDIPPQQSISRPIFYVYILF